MLKELKEIRPKKTYEQVAESLRNLIYNGTYKPGDKLPTLVQISEQLNVSKATVREALSALQANGLIIVRHGEGYYVSQVDMDPFQRAMSGVMLLADDLRQLTEVRRILEVGACRLAALHRTSEDLLLLEELLQAMRHEDTEEVVRADAQFHLAIARAAKNQVLYALLQTMAPIMQQSMVQSQILRSTDWDLVQEHETIYQSIYTQNGELAAESMLRHLDSVLRYTARG
ncbi:FadR/GntR family transcriptional regulator [Sulfoacidibacillus thermotolerans]|uniref:HTH gntR-type domain-containing protein n=1 Tax=Sulfoacidibacillus thermotolerans TaxID=1765684 RepID=A0A2U3D7Y0_SULT2|nr:FadR/GntR family transcriptional regulator [Sulfoacidibacillus thermotolerans]PWI57385.1 hypothetical protein BM613_08640 [Sulfoacidibacillus thermotolerans]